MIKVVDYTPEHLAKIDLGNWHRGERPAEIGMQAVTFLMDEEPIAIFGWYFILPGCAQGWALLSKRIKEIPFAFHRETRELLDRVIKLYSVRRLQVSIRSDYKMGYKWARSLGFNCEGLMNYYAADNCGCWLVARTNPCLA